MAKYEVAILHSLTDYPDVIGTFDSKQEVLDFIRKQEERNPRQRYAWREVVNG